jgi:hypothetical protein
MCELTATRGPARSSGLGSSRWIFSINDIAAADSSRASQCRQAVEPARRAARNRRSPAMISYLPAAAAFQARTKIRLPMPALVVQPDR